MLAMIRLAALAGLALLYPLRWWAARRSPEPEMFEWGDPWQ